MWINVKDKLPQPGHLVDVYHRKRGRYTDVYAYYIDKTNNHLAYWQDKWGNYIGNELVTHWREIPKPPHNNQMKQT